MNATIYGNSSVIYDCTDEQIDRNLLRVILQYNNIRTAPNRAHTSTKAADVTKTVTIKQTLQGWHIIYPPMHAEYLTLTLTL